jgi:hypothetical protein
MNRPPLEHRLRETLTRTAPLGPSDAAQISDTEVAAQLFDPHNKSFNTLIRRDVALLLGRRGSGKTALLNSYKYRPYLDGFGHPDNADPHGDFRAYHFVIEVIAYKQFDEMQRLVMRDPGFRPVEALVEDWQTLVLDYFFARLIDESENVSGGAEQLESLRRYLDQEEADDYRQQVRRQVWGTSLFAKIRAFLLGHRGDEGPAYITTKMALDAAVAYLEAVKKRAVIVFDSMDEYETSNKALTRCLGALIRFISHFNAAQDRVKIKLGLPLEIFPEVQRASANALKDLPNVDQLRWTAVELQQIAAHRFRLFLQLYEPAQARALGAFDLNRRDDVRRFWSRFLPDRQVNRYGGEEEAMTYVLRHTQLLPRQFLMIIQRIIVTSAGSSNSYGLCSGDAVREAITETEPLIANEILSAFSNLYPHAEVLCRPVFANFPTVFSYDELEAKFRRRARSIAQQKDPDFDMSQFGEMLVRMGIVGVGQGETDRYYSGLFGYDALSPTNIGEGQELCLHPIFSKHFSAGANAKKKAIIPQGVGA